MFSILKLNIQLVQLCIDFLECIQIVFRRGATQGPYAIVLVHFIV